MPDPTDPAEPVQAAQDAVEPAEPTSPPVFEGDFDPDRARRTIDHLRSREKELEQQAKEFDRLQNDPDAFKEFAERLGYDFDDGAPEPVFDDPDPIAELRSEVESLKAARNAEEFQKVTFETNAKELDEIQALAGRDLSPDEIETLIGLAPEDDKGIPHIKPVWDAITKLIASQQDAPSFRELGGSSGGQGSEKFDIRDPEQRIARFVASMERHSGD